MLSTAYIDLSVIKNNALEIKSKLKKKTRLCAVVKADAYGHGAVEVASAIYKIADCFAVAHVEEGVKLRRAGIDKDILVLLPALDKDECERAVFHRLTLTVESAYDIAFLENVCENMNSSVLVHLKINTGMNRLGVCGEKEIKDTLNVFANSKRVILDGFYTHFANPENKNSFLVAQNKFLLANNLVKGYNKKVTAHASASGGFIRGAHYDMVRIGILLYGYKPFESDYVNVAPAMKVYAPRLRLRSLKGGETALYGDKIVMDDVDLNLIAYGYADGLWRKNVSGQFYDRCMDVTAVTDCEEVGLGVPVMIDADKLAKEYGTISYEVLTKCALRAKKVYVR